MPSPLTSAQIKRKRILVSKFKDDTINHIETQELMAILEKKKYIAEDVGDGILAFAISSLISHLTQYSESQSKIK
jgi:hypothetical protein